MGPIILGVSVWHRDYGGLFDVCGDHSLTQGDVKDVCEDSAVPEHPAWHVVFDEYLHFAFPAGFGNHTITKSDKQPINLN